MRGGCVVPISGKSAEERSSSVVLRTMVGETVSHYVLLESLGTGGIGVVYKARDSHLDRIVALKILRPDMIVGLEARDRFVREARLASALNHPNIINVYDVDDTADIHFIAMEWINGRTLAEIIASNELTLQEC